MNEGTRSGERGTVRVLITSVDGNVEHPFKRTDTVGDVRRFSYDRLVQDKNAVSFSATAIEFSGRPLPDDQGLGTLITGGKQPGSEVDLTLSLTWVTQGGAKAGAR